jgi:hypothetical protein
VTRSNDIFLIKGILMKLDMMDCKSMTTPIMKNINNLSDSTSYSYLVYPKMYRKLIGSLMYLVNTSIDTFFSP